VEQIIVLYNEITGQRKGCKRHLVDVSVTAATIISTRPVTRLGHQVDEEFCESDPIFLTISNSFKLCPKHFSRGEEKFCRRSSPPLVTGLISTFAMYYLNNHGFPIFKTAGKPLHRSLRVRCFIRIANVLMMAAVVTETPTNVVYIFFFGRYFHYKAIQHVYFSYTKIILSSHVVLSLCVWLTLPFCCVSIFLLLFVCYYKPKLDSEMNKEPREEIIMHIFPLLPPTAAIT